MPIDYSKWDHIGSDSDDDDVQRKRPTVTAFDAPQSITIPAAKESKFFDVTPSVAKQSISTDTTNAVTSKCEKNDAIAAVTSQPVNGAIQEDYAWTQDRTQVIFWIKLPSYAVFNVRKTERDVTLLTEEPPADLRKNVVVPEAIVASDFDESKDDGDQGLFPVAWGMQIKWPIDPTSSSGGSPGSAFWQQVNGGTMIQTSKLWFCYPVMLGESTWSWTLESSCPYFSDKECRYIKVELTKKRSQSLHNVNLMWNRGLLTEPNRITITRSPAEQARHDAWVKSWQEAHEEFKAKVKTMEPTVIN